MTLKTLQGKLIMTKLSMMLIIVLRLENDKLNGGGTFIDIFPVPEDKIKTPKLS